MADPQIEAIKAQICDPAKTAAVMDALSRLNQQTGLDECLAIEGEIRAQFPVMSRGKPPKEKPADPGWRHGDGKAEGVLLVIDQKIAGLEVVAAERRVEKLKEPDALGIMNRVHAMVECHYTHVAGHVFQTIMGNNPGQYKPPTAAEVKRSEEGRTTDEHDRAAKLRSRTPRKMSPGSRPSGRRPQDEGENPGGSPGGGGGHSM